MPICSWAITKRNGYNNLTKERFSYKRYVDDIFCMFGNEKDAEKFVEFLNYHHKNIKFAIVKESNKFLSFLDILIKSEGNRFSTLVYRKKTSIGLFKQFHSFTPMSYTIGLIRCLIHRAFKISSSQIIFHNESEKIKILLQKNMYRKSVIDNQIKTFLDKQCRQCRQCYNFWKTKSIAL